MTSDATCGPWASSLTFCFVAIRRFPAIVAKIAAGIAVRTVVRARSCSSSPFKKVLLPVFVFYNIFTKVSWHLTGHFTFPEAEWHDVSDEAKDLICRLLVKQASSRLSAEAVLNHKWIRMCEHEPPVKQCGRHKALQTPANIRRYDIFK